jgi:hypothetical protein
MVQEMVKKFWIESVKGGNRLAQVSWDKKMRLK